MDSFVAVSREGEKNNEKRMNKAQMLFIAAATTIFFL